MADKRSLLKRYWGYDTFRPLQEEIIDSVVAGNDTMVLLPTGGGKSLCYQLPTLMAEGLCLVVSPLIALMKDQVHQLNDRGIKAACIVSGMSQTDVVSVLVSSLYGKVKFLYVSPERLRQRLFIEHFRRMKVCLIAVDEAHCVSQWGYDFRPPYLQISDLRVYHPEVPLMALTATATPGVVADIKRNLKMRDARHFQSSFTRANLCYSVVHDDNKTARMLDIIGHIGGCGIVYTRSRRMTQHVADMLTAVGITAAAYHAGLTAAERDRRQALWMQDKCRVMVATNAFGMGIDKADVRFVIHLDVPDSLEAYYQEAGRAGRDGKESHAILLCSGADGTRMERDLATDFPPVRYIRNVYRSLCNYFKLPLGSGADSRFDFELEEVCSAYGFNVREFYSACRFLEREGLIAMPEQDDASSMLYIPVGREELYRFQVEHLAAGNVLQAVMRLYPGVLTKTVPIDERKVASRCGIEPHDVAALLTSMHALKVVEYRQRPSKPQIIFTSARVNENDIYLGEHNYESLKNAAVQRLDAMKGYIANDKMCRSRQLAAYFGEVEGVADCGMCDVCRRHFHGDLNAAVRDALQHGALSPQALQSMLWGENKDEVSDAVRGMMDRGELYLDDNMLLRLS